MTGILPLHLKGSRNLSDSSTLSVLNLCQMTTLSPKQINGKLLHLLKASSNTTIK